MKRSQMVSIIADYLYELNLEPDEATCKADDLLNKLEISGMLPPFSFDVHSKTWRDGGDGHEWDKE